MVPPKATSFRGRHFYKETLAKIVKTTLPLQLTDKIGNFDFCIKITIPQKSLLRFWGEQWLGVPENLKNFWGDRRDGSRIRRENEIDFLSFLLPYNFICWCGGSGSPKTARFWGDQWQTDGSRVRRENEIDFLSFLLPYNFICWCGGMADATDSKSVEGNFMWVRLPPPAPRKNLRVKCSFLFKSNTHKSGRRTLG